MVDTLLGKWVEAGKLNPEFYLALVTMHGTIMVFFVLTAGLSGTFSNFLIPLQIGARDMASGFMNMLSYWFFFASSIIMFTSLFIETGPASAGWTIYPPLSALPQAIPGSGAGMTLWLVSMALFIVSQLLGGVNYITTVINLRTRGMSMSKVATYDLVVFPDGYTGFAFVSRCCSQRLLLLIFDRSFGTSFFLSDIYIAGQALNKLVVADPVPALVLVLGSPRGVHCYHACNGHGIGNTWLPMLVSLFSATVP